MSRRRAIKVTTMGTNLLRELTQKVFLVFLVFIGAAILGTILGFLVGVTLDTWRWAL